MQENKVVQKLNNHLSVVPYSIDRDHFIMAIQEIERLQNIIDSFKTQYTDHMLRRVDDAQFL